MPTYRVFGLTVASDIPLPNLAAGSGPADVVVRMGTVPEGLPGTVSRGVFFEAAPDNYLLRIESVGRYLVREGREVTIDPTPAADPDRLRTFLLGPVFTAVLHQRGSLVLHASGVIGRSGAVLLAGHSGAGKSTLAAELARRGHVVLCDDAAAIVSDSDGHLVVHAGVPQLNLWKDAVDRMGVSPRHLVAELADVDKFAVRGPFAFSTVPHRVSAVFVVEGYGGRDAYAEDLPDADRFAAIKEHTRQFRVVNALQTNQSHFRLAAQVAQRVPMKKLWRPNSRDVTKELGDLVAPMLA